MIIMINFIPGTERERVNNVINKVNNVHKYKNKLTIKLKI